MLMEFLRDKEGKLIIEDGSKERDTADNHFYFNKKGEIDYELPADGDLCEGLKTCLEAARQTGKKVHYATCNAGRMVITPEMSERDAANVFVSRWLARKKTKSDNDELADEEKRLPKGITMKDLFIATQMLDRDWHDKDIPGRCTDEVAEAAQNAAKDKVFRFCNAHKIDPAALILHCEMAGVPLHAEFYKEFNSQQAFNSTFEYGIPHIITEDNISRVKDACVLSADDARVTDLKKMKVKAVDIQND